MTTPTNGNYRRRDYRCPNCGRLLFRAYLTAGTVILIRCQRCSRDNQIGKDDQGVFFREEVQELPASA